LKLERLAQIIEDGLMQFKTIEEIAETIRDELNNEAVWGEDVID
jgi:hypothetical protein